MGDTMEDESMSSPLPSGPFKDLSMHSNGSNNSTISHHASSSSSHQKKENSKEKEHSTQKKEKGSESALKKESRTPVKKGTRLSTGTTPKKTEKAEKAEKAGKGEKGEKTVKSTVKKAAKGATPAGSATAKKRKISELEKDVNDMKTNLDKLRKDKVKLQRTIEEQINLQPLTTVYSRLLQDEKYPVRDDLIVSTDVKGRAPQPLPEALMTLDLPQGMAADAISVWDFLNNFRKQMSLSPVAIDPLIALLSFTGRPSPALTELFTAPLKLLLSDPKLSSKLSAMIPRRLNFAYRSASGARSDIEGSDGVEGEFDTSFNGIRFLPRQLKSEIIDPLTWQGILRAVLLRLDPVKQLRRAAGEVPEVCPIPAPPLKIKSSTPFHVNGSNEEKEKGEKEDEEGIDGVASSSSRRLTFSMTLEEARGNLLLSQGDNIGSLPNDKDSKDVGKNVSEEGLRGRHEGLDVKKNEKCDSKSEVKSEGKVGGKDGKEGKEGKEGKKRGILVNKDHTFLVTNDPRQDFALVLEAAVLLETQELHTLSITHKLAALKAICDACYDTQRLTELLASNAEERAERATAMNKKIREEKAKSKEVSVARTASAVERCREINILAAAEVNKSSKGPKAKGWKMHDPTPTQVANMLEEMALLEKLDIDEVIESLPEEEPLSDDEDEDNDFTLQPDGSYVMRNRASVRGKANDRKRQRIERDQKLIHVNVAKECIEHALATGGEKELKNAIRLGVKAGLRGKNDDKTYCTELLKQAYKMQLSLETTAKEEKALSAYEKELSELCVRSSPLGSDRFHRRYWMFAHSEYDEQRLFVECDTSLAYFRGEIVGNTGNYGTSGSSGHNGIPTVASTASSGMKISDGDKNEKNEKVVSDTDTTQYVLSYPEGNTYAGALRSVKPSQKKQITDRSIDLPDFIQIAADSSGIDLKSDQPLCRLISSRPSARVSKWGVYTSSELWFLCEALDERGERERELKHAIKSHFDISEPPVVFFKTGSEYIGRTVVRVFGKKRRVTGIITGWLPASGEDCALWHVNHSDGDNEDLELHEVLEGVQAAIDSETEEKDKEDDTANMPEKRESSRKKCDDNLVDMKSEREKREKKEKKEKKEDEEKEEEEEDEPELVSSNRSITTGYQGIKVTQLGVTGLKAELLRVQLLLLDGLKRRGSAYPRDREGRRAWENSVKQAEEITELRSAVLELEAVVRSVQEGEDENDDVEAEREKVQARAIMLTEGWRFAEDKGEKEGKEEKKNGRNGKSSSEKSEKNEKNEKISEKSSDKPDDELAMQLSFIGKSLRRFFKGHGKSDGVIVGYLPADKNEGMELWRMEHQDGDEEDLDLSDVVKSVRWYEENMMEDDEAKGVEEEEEEEEEEELVDEGEEEERAEGEISSTLWPTAGVRARWLDALQRSKTTSEIAMALGSLLDYSRTFGMMLEEEVTVLGKRKQAPKNNFVPGASPYKRKGKGHVEQEGGRIQRAAARRVVSYAE